jgi:hypothetical protein
MLFLTALILLVICPLAIVADTVNTAVKQNNARK